MLKPFYLKWKCPLGAQCCCLKGWMFSYCIPELSSRRLFSAIFHKYKLCETQNTSPPILSLFIFKEYIAAAWSVSYFQPDHRSIKTFYLANGRNLRVMQCALVVVTANATLMQCCVWIIPQLSDVLVLIRVLLGVKHRVALAKCRLKSIALRI